MTTQIQNALQQLKNIGPVDQMNELADRGYGPQTPLKVNAHIHLPPNFSAFESVRQAVELAADQQIDTLGVSNYYDFEVYGDFFKLARQHDIFPLFGLEIIALIDSLVRSGVKINDPGNPGKMYICGKGITRLSPMTDKAQELIGLIRRSDAERMANMIDRLSAVFEKNGVPTGLTADKVIDRVMTRHDCPRERITLQERHLAMAFQESLFTLVPESDRTEKLTQLFGTTPKAKADDAVGIQNEIRSHLLKAGKPAFVEETFINFDQAYRLILELGGVPCYPTLADGTAPICGFENPVEELIANLKERRIFAAEFVPVRNNPEVLSRYVGAMRQAGLVVTAGTEHNTLDLLPIEPTCLKGQPVPEPIREIFREGAYVVAAHQYLTLNGQCGFVDADGNPNPAYKTDEDRIDAFRKLGAAVIQRYRENKD